MKRLAAFFLLAILAGCGSNSQSATSSPSVLSQQKAAFTASELAGHTIYKAEWRNQFGAYSAYSFSADGTVVACINELANGTPIPSSAGTWRIDNGALVISLSGYDTEYIVKDSAVKNTLYNIQDAVDQFGNWSPTLVDIFYAANGEEQAKAYATGQAVPMAL